MPTEPKALRGVTGQEQGDGIPVASWRRRHLGERTAVRLPEAECAVGLARRLIALFVHRAVMPPAEQREIRELRRAALGPVMKMMGLNDPDSAPGKAAGPVSM